MRNFRPPIPFPIDACRGRSVAAPRLVIFLGGRFLGLTPQAKYLSPLRGSVSTHALVANGIPNS